ncbi:MAG: hypothetical protein E6G58_00030 [Actinobacteria bacterium]|nr:MAG: hypothetical protein E6G58_00030 [Actinomycetota bacterium]
MKDPERPGEKLGIVQVLETIGILELLGGAYLLVTVQHTDVSFGGDLIPITTQTHDWALGIAYLAAAIFVSALWFGFATSSKISMT